MSQALTTKGNEQKPVVMQNRNVYMTRTSGNTVLFESCMTCKHHHLELVHSTRYSLGTARLAAKSAVPQNQHEIVTFLSLLLLSTSVVFIKHSLSWTFNTLCFELVLQNSARVTFLLCEIGILLAYSSPSDHGFLTQSILSAFIPNLLGMRFMSNCWFAPRWEGIFSGCVWNR